MWKYADQSDPNQASGSCYGELYIDGVQVTVFKISETHNNSYTPIIKDNWITGYHGVDFP